ncbi:MAG: DNRLRE domain-containing protein [Candidatus Eremiobacteraeota bacterium]|nr:DNRLRE domain-containing protein [Candidatus Eremiobacteraeota bacterium]
MQNYRYDEFRDILQPVLKSETIKVPATAPFYVPLEELPLETVPSSVLVRDSASTTTNNPTKDCTVVQQSGLNDDGVNFFVGRMSASGGGWLYRAFVGFDISALPSSPAKVLLRLYLAGLNGDSNTQTIGVYQVTSSWTETGPTWASQPTFNTTPYGSIAIAPRTDGKFGAGEGYSGWVECDVTALYNLWKSGTNNGLMLRADESVYSYCTFNSRTAGASIAPQLVVISSGAVYTQVGQTVTPGAKEFACAYTTGRLRFGTAAAGLTLQVDYQGLGSPVDAADVMIRGTTTGSSTAYVLATSNLVALVPNLVVMVTFHTGSGTSPTLNISSLGVNLGPKQLYRQSNNTQITSSGVLAASVPYLAVYDGTKFIVMGV